MELYGKYGSKNLSDNNEQKQYAILHYLSLKMYLALKIIIVLVMANQVFQELLF